MSQTGNTGWLAYTTAVAVMLAATVFVLVVNLAYRGYHPESIHGFLTACEMVVFFGGPSAGLFGGFALNSARRRSQTIPSYARYAAYCAWGPAICVATYILAGFVYVYATRGFNDRFL